MIVKFVKKNGFPSRYGYACGHGKTEYDNDNHKSIFECESHNCINVKAMIDGKHTWEQFFHVDEGGFSKAARKAEAFYKKLKV